MTKYPSMILHGAPWPSASKVTEIKDQATADAFGIGAFFRSITRRTPPPLAFEIRDIAAERRRDFVHNSDGSLSLTERGVREWKRNQ